MKKIKKILRYFFIVILILSAVFFSLGLVFPSVTYESRVTVSKPIEASFGVFTNALKLSDWILGLKGVAWISGDQNQVGSKWKFIITMDGRDYEMVQTLNAFRANELFAFHTDNDLFAIEADVKFLPKGSATEIIATSHLTGKNYFWKCAFVFGQFYVGSHDQLMYEKLKEVIEKE